MRGLTEIDGIGPSLAAACVKNHFGTIARIAAATPRELSVVPGISEKGANTIIVSAKTLLPKAGNLRISNNNKQRAVAPLKSGKRAPSPKANKPSTREQESEQGQKLIIKSSVKPSVKEKKMSALESKEKIKKLKKKIKKLKTEKKKVLTKGMKALKKEKAKKKGKKK